MIGALSKLPSEMLEADLDALDTENGDDLYSLLIATVTIQSKLDEPSTLKLLALPCLPWAEDLALLQKN